MGRTKKFTDEELWEATQSLLLEVGYEAFTVSLLAEKMGVSRAVIYKYYPNKEELICEYMLINMKYSIAYLTDVNVEQTFLKMFREVLKRIYEMKELHQVLSLATKIGDVSAVVKEKKDTLTNMHQEMYVPLLYLIKKGKSEGLIEEEQNDFLLLSFIFSAINIPNHMQMPEREFLNCIEQLLLKGLLNRQD